MQQYKLIDSYNLQNLLQNDFTVCSLTGNYILIRNELIAMAIHPEDRYIQTFHADVQDVLDEMSKAGILEEVGV